MTTLCYSPKHRSLAFDSLATSGGYRTGMMRKGGLIQDVFYAGCGCALMVKQFLDWVETGMKGEPPKLQIPDGNSDPYEAACFIWRGSMELTFMHAGVEYSEIEYGCYGSGKSIALGALVAGATPEEAVRAACAMDIHSGGHINVVSLP